MLWYTKNFKYFINIIKINFLKNRTTVLDGSEAMMIGARIPQGTMLGPLLWNIIYHVILNMGLIIDI